METENKELAHLSFFIPERSGDLFSCPGDLFFLTFLVSGLAPSCILPSYHIPAYPSQKGSSIFLVFFAFYLICLVSPRLRTHNMCLLLAWHDECVDFTCLPYRVCLRPSLRGAGARQTTSPHPSPRSSESEDSSFPFAVSKLPKYKALNPISPHRQ